MSGTQNQFDTDVLVVGSGPAGGAMALALATYGVRVTVITKYGQLADTPRAHITNQRTMEVFRDLGLEDAVREGGHRWEQTFGGRAGVFEEMFKTEESRATFIAGMHGFGLLASPVIDAMWGLLWLNEQVINQEGL